jgi:hypothetical protein
MSNKLINWTVIPYWEVLWKWRKWTGKKSMLGWCAGDCIDNPINWDYERKEPK